MIGMRSLYGGQGNKMFFSLNSNCRWGFTNIKVKEDVWVNQDSDRMDMNCAFLVEGKMKQGQCNLQKGVLCEKKLGSY